MNSIESCCESCGFGSHLYDCPIRIDELEAENERLRAALASAEARLFAIYELAATDEVEGALR